jgi:AAA15 family ATPase/GTPase
MASLLQFTVGNFLSFCDKKTFSMKASSIQDDPRSNVVVQNRYKLLRTAAVYGANSSGKSNLIRAFTAMGEMVLMSIKLNDSDLLNYRPFLLSNETKEAPTHFEIVYVEDSKRIRYGFEYTLTEIVAEWLFMKESTHAEKPLFIRTREGIGIVDADFPEGIDLEEKTNDNRLFLSLVAQLGGTISKQIMQWFKYGYSTISGLESLGYAAFTKNMFLNNRAECKEALAFFKKLQLGFQDVSTEMREVDAHTFDKAPDEIKNLLNKLKGKKQMEVLTKHHVYNKAGKIVGEEIFSLENDESAGTNKIFELSGPIFDTLAKGTVLIVDELDAKMHPLISQYVVDLFNNPDTNPYCAQLIFTTHDTHLLSSKSLRRDQIWFTEKDKQECTDLYTIMDIRLPDGTKPRNDSNYERNYINGRYGAIPYIVNF